MADDFPIDVDVVVFGTGLPESIVSAAISRAGKKVLHLDRNDFYGSQWATFTLANFIEFIDNQKKLAENKNDKESKTDYEATKSIVISDSAQCIWNVVVESFMPSCDEIEEVDLADENLSTDLNAWKEHVTKTENEDENNSSNLIAEKDNDGDIAFSETSIKHESASQAKDKDTTSSDINASNNDALDAEHKDPSDTVIDDMSAEKGTDDTAPSYNGSDNPTAQTNSGEEEDTDSCDSITISNTMDNPSSASAVNQEEKCEKDIAKEAKLKKTKSHLEIQAKLMNGSKNITMEDLISQSRKFNIDLAPKLLFSRGNLVESLIEANISHYADFRILDRILTLKDDTLVELPCSKGDVFKSNLFTVIEKRILMKFLTFCQQFDSQTFDVDESEIKTFAEFMRSKRLTDKLIEFILYAVAMTNMSCPVLEGLQRTKLFLSSVGRYGNSPCLWAMYGVSEIPQAFCRMSAVFAGTFCLRKGINTLELNEEGLCCSVVDDKAVDIKTKYVVIEESSILHHAEASVSRCILLTVGSLKESCEEHLTLSVLPPITKDGNPVSILEVGASSAAAPKGIYVTHLTVTHPGNAEENLSPYVTKFFSYNRNEDSSKPRVLWSVYYNCNDGNAINNKIIDLPKNVFATSSPGGSMNDIDNAIIEARKIFDQICPGEKFLEAVPNPEDIIWDAPLTAPDASSSGFEGNDKEDNQSPLEDDKSNNDNDDSHSNADESIEKKEFVSDEKEDNKKLLKY